MAKTEEKKSKKRKEVETVEGDVSMTAEQTAEDRPSKKVKKEKLETLIDVKNLSPIAHPLAEHKLQKKLHKCIKKASKQRQVRRGVKEVVKALRKGEKGLLILAADITPMDIISHLPVLAEDENVPYIWLPSKEELGSASGTKRPTSCVMVCPDAKKRKRKDDAEKDEKNDDYREVLDECCKEIGKLHVKIAF